MKSHRASAARLRALRIDRGLSPEQLGYVVGVSGQTIRRVEAARGNPNASTQYALASFFGMRVTEMWPLEAQPVRRRRLVASVAQPIHNRVAA